MSEAYAQAIRNNPEVIRLEAEAQFLANEIDKASERLAQARKEYEDAIAEMSVHNKLLKEAYINAANLAKSQA